VGIDRSDDLECGEVDRVPGPDGVGRVRDVCGDGGGRTDASNLAEAGDRDEYYASLREEAWGEAVERFRTGWDEHRKRWPDEEREPVDRSADPPGSWRGDSNRYLDGAANAEVDARYGRIADVERSVVSPAMREVESCDSSRTLVGWEYRLKSADRLKDKVAEGVEERGRTPPEALSMVKDAVRFTFVYSEDRYAEGVWADVARMEDKGFEPAERRNTWAEDQYKGINSRWREPETGLLFEVQFHTKGSFEAKQLTHCSYERVRDPATDRAELGELRELQANICRQIPIPPGAADIPDYPEEKK
jgi:hypothetical protein